MAKKTILIVEDNMSNMRLAKLLLSSLYDVATAVDAESALSFLKNTTPHLILMDIQLPGMDGLQLTSLLKNTPNTKHIPIIAVTAYSMECDREKAIHAGCDGYITKPYDKRLLLLTIESFLHR